MTTATSTIHPRDLNLCLLDMTNVVVTGPVAGVWTVTAPDTITQSVLDAAVVRAALALTIETNFDALISKAKAALVANATYRALPTKTNAQVVAQVDSLTKQVNALIKLRVQDLADTTGT